MIREKSKALFDEALTYFPGGVNSPVRAFQSVGGTPPFIESGKGSKIKDADGNEYIDYCCSWGPLILGHANPEVKEAIQKALDKGFSFGAPTAYENELANIILSNNSFIEKIRFVSSGTEAVMSAIRLARGFTKRTKIIKFEGCYHGHADSLLVKAGSGLATFGISSSAGIPESFANETVVLPLNDENAVTEAFQNYPEEIACIIIEPIPANNGLLIQEASYLEFLRDITQKNSTLLIFDEVISGFRVGFNGAAGHYNIRPDIITYGKIIGGGLPVGAYASSSEIMKKISPEGDVYQAGTLSGNPIAMAAGIAQLKACLADGFYEGLEHKTDALQNTIMDHVNDKGYNFKLFTFGSIFWISFSDQEVIRSAGEIDAKGMDTFNLFYNYLLDNGIYLGPSSYEVGFVSAAHTNEDIERTAQLMISGLDEVLS